MSHFAKTFLFILTCAVLLPCTALLQPVFAETQASKRRKITITITTHLGDHQTFREGDEVSFLLNLDRDAYVLLIYETAAGDLVQIVPNRHEPQAFYPAGLFMPLPDRTAPFRFKIEAPFGEEKIWAFATDIPFPELEEKTMDKGLKLLALNLKVIRNQILSGKVGAFGETVLLIFSKPSD